MSKEQDRIFFRNYSIVIGILAVMIVIFLFVARAIGVNEDAEAAQRADMVDKLTMPVGQVNVQGEAEASAEPPQVATAAPAAPAAGDEEAGKRVYSGLCFSCHGTGLPGIPQLGDTGAWSERISKGMAILYDHALSGFTGTSGMLMPPRGGNAALSDDEVKAAVDYMVANSK